jgi:hypothetical protein
VLALLSICCLASNRGLSSFCLLAVAWLNVACPGPRFSALLAALPLRSLLCFGCCSFSLSSNFFPGLFASRYSSQQLFVILRFALLAKVFGWGVVVGQTHAVIMLPRFAVVAADHSSLYVFFLFVKTADAAYDRVFFFVIVGFCPSVGFGAFAFSLALGTFLFADVSVFRVLAFGCSSRAAGFVCKEDMVSFIESQANTLVGDAERFDFCCLPAIVTRCTRHAIIYSASMKQN